VSLARVAVVGAGLIGGSAALRLRDLGADVVVTDPDPVTREQAAGAGLATADTVGAELADRDLVVLAGPLPTLARALVEVAQAAPRAVLVDVGSVKQPLARAAADAGLADRYVGAHPMWGRETSGFGAASADLLRGVTWAVTRPAPAAVPAAGAVVRWLVASYDARVVVLDAAEHDRSVALVSHAPHVLAHLLLEAAEQGAGTALGTGAGAGPAAHLAAGSFRDATRVAGTHPERTGAMLGDNADALGAVLDDLADRLAGYRAALADPDRSTLGARLRAVADAAPSVRAPETAWSRCDDLAPLLVAGPPVLVRGGAGGLEQAPA